MPTQQLFLITFRKASNLQPYRKAALEEDVEAMFEAGFGGALILDVNAGIPYLSKRLRRQLRQ